MPEGDKKDPWELSSVSPPPFEETRLLGLTEESLPVRPLRSPLERTLILAILALGLGALALTLTSIRDDLGQVPWAVAYGPALVELLAGAGVFWLAMRWSVPGSGERLSRSSILLAIAFGLALAAALAGPPSRDPGSPRPLCRNSPRNGTAVHGLGTPDRRSRLPCFPLAHPAGRDRFAGSRRGPRRPRCGSSLRCRHASSLPCRGPIAHGHLASRHRGPARCGGRSDRQDLAEVVGDLNGPSFL